MKRRDFLVLAGGGAAWPLCAGAQPKMPVVGIMALGNPSPELFMTA